MLKKHVILTVPHTAHCSPIFWKLPTVTWRLKNGWDVMNSIRGTNLVLGPPEKFYRRNPSGTFRDVHWYHLGDPKKVPGAPSQGFLTFLGFDKNSTKIENWLSYPHFLPIFKCHTISESYWQHGRRGLLQVKIRASTNEIWAFQKWSLGAPGTFFRSPKWYQWTSLKVPEGFLRKKIFRWSQYQISALEELLNL